MNFCRAAACGAALAGLVLSLSPAGAHPSGPGDIAACERLIVDQEAVKARTEPFALPAQWQDFATSSVNWIAVATTAGATHCVDISWYDEAREFERFGDRFIGFEWSGLEAWGYVLVDRARLGQRIDTGARPVFSTNGLLFATVQWSESGWGGFEGFAVYSVNPVGFEPVHVDTQLPDLADWRVDRWLEADCVQLSAVPHERIGYDYERLAGAERDIYIARAADGWRLTRNGGC